MAIKFPTRDYFTFSELMRRWECESNDIRSLLVHGLLIPSCIVNIPAYEVRLEDCEEAGKAVLIGEPVENDDEYLKNFTAEETEQFRYKLVDTAGFYYLLNPWQTAPFDCNFVYFSRDRIRKLVAGDICLMGSRKPVWPMNVEDVMKNGVVMRAEVETYEQNNAEVSVRPLSTNERTAMLNTIAALLELVQNPRPGRDSDAAVIRELVQNYSDKYGISKSKLESRFPEAKRSLISN